MPKFKFSKKLWDTYSLYYYNNTIIHVCLRSSHYFIMSEIKNTKFLILYLQNYVTNKSVITFTCFDHNKYNNIIT